jgi:hypothetical protein
MKLVLLLSSLAAGPLLASGATFTANPSADAFVTTGPSGNLSGNNYGGAGAFALSAPGLPQGELQSVLRFDLSGALSSFNGTFGAGQWSIESVTLQLNAAPANNSIFNTSAAGQFGISWMQNDSWLEGAGTPGAPGASGITFSSLQTTFIGPGDQSLGTFNFSGATGGAFTYSLGLTPGLTGDVLTGDNLSLRLFGADSMVSGVFNSRSFGTLANWPLLTIVAVPEPGTLALGALGLTLLAGRPWSRRRK